jgi:tetratricopeptide (TPR) repeat protein
MKHKVFSLVLIGLLLLAGLLLAATFLNPKVEADATAVAAANQLYTAGHYDEAIQLYEAQVARGVEDSALYYNLGNAYFQQGDMGRAVLNLERAAQLNPRDADIANNLTFVRQQTTELFAAEPEGPLALLSQITGWLTVNETAVLVLGIWFLLGFLLLARRQAENARMRNILQAGAILLLVLLLLTGASLASREFLQQTLPAGVVVSPTVAISDGPGAEFATDIQLSGGMKVNVRDSQGDWLRLQAPQGAGEQWVPAAAVEPVY